MEFKKLLIVIPTRNRVYLAINAINSVLNQKNCNFELIVSDNSTEQNEVDTLSEYCQNIEDKRLHYIRPPEPLSMTEHWNWVMEKGLQNSLISHVTFLTDRMLFLNDSLSELQNILSKFEKEVISFCTDKVKDSQTPLVLWQMKWTGKLYEVNSSTLIKYFSNTEIIYHPIPRMLNCVVSVDLLKKIHRKFGNYFASVSPDFNFAFRVLDLFDSTYFYDKPLLIQYGIERSNGMNIIRGVLNKEAKDFLKNLDTRSVNFNTPVDDICIVPNVILHEYYEVQKTSQSGKFPSINNEKYFISLVDNVYNYSNLEVKKKMLEKLTAELGIYKINKFRLKQRIFRYKSAIKIRIHNILNPSNPLIKFNEFQTIEEAVKYANEFSRIPHSGLDLSKENLRKNDVGVKIILESVRTN